MTALFAALTAVGAFIVIPSYPVPVTLQTLFTYLAGAVLGGSLGALSQLIARALLGPTGGYLMGFIVGSFIIGKLVETKGNPSFTWILISMVIGTLAIYTLGVIQLSLWLKTSIEHAISLGVLPFLIGDSLKILLASFITLRVRKILSL